MEDLGLSVIRNPDENFWRDKRVLLTGHTGFKGAWLVCWLHRLGAKVSAISLPPLTLPNLFTLAAVGELCEGGFCDIRDSDRLTRLITAAEPEVVFHLAAQPLVRTGYREPLRTFSTNVQGTANVLEAVRSVDSVRCVVVVTTDKVYRILEQRRAHTESDLLGGHDPYGASKAAAEFVIASYRDSFLAEAGVMVASARAGNVIGGGDWSPDRLLPDAVRAWSTNKPLTVRNPEAIRPWQHVLEPLAGYLVLAEAMWDDPSLAGAYNFGPAENSAATVQEVARLAQKYYGKGETIWGDDREGPTETSCLSLDSSKARAVLGVLPRWTLDEAVHRTMKWYRLQIDGADVRKICETDLAEFELPTKEPSE